MQSTKNLIARVAKLCERVTLKSSPTPTLSQDYKQGIENFKFNEVLEIVWSKIKVLDQQINSSEPWKVTDQKKLTQILQSSVNGIVSVANELKPFLPNTSEKIEEQFKGPKIISEKPLFPRIQKIQITQMQAQTKISLYEVLAFFSGLSVCANQQLQVFPILQYVSQRHPHHKTGLFLGLFLLSFRFKSTQWNQSCQQIA